MEFIWFVLAVLIIVNLITFVIDISATLDPIFRGYKRKDDEELTFVRLKSVEVYRVWHILLAVCLLPAWAVYGLLYGLVTLTNYILKFPVFTKRGKGNEKTS
ncbi:hypothetical protein NYE44_30475 [Paenibacillus sp. FSL L8-0493]|uniref:hypothetical protein n=1 Tax=Paenibacillus sp. FSL L8-0493 TaxID=2975333 RepID=UPI0030FD943E